MSLLEIHLDHLTGDQRLGGAIPASEVAELRLNRAPLELVLRDGRIGFVSAVRRRDLAIFGRLHGIPVVERDDVWSLLTEDFLDTERGDEVAARTLDRLESNGISRPEAHAIRRFIASAMTRRTTWTWEWVHYGLWDLIEARPLKILPPWGEDAVYLPRDRSVAELRRWAEGIANRAPIRRRLPREAEPSDDEVLRQLQHHFFSPAWAAGSDWGDRARRLDGLRDQLLAAWSAPGRCYHGPRHLLAVLDAVKSHSPSTAFKLASWFHDAVYEPTRSDNEEESARWLESSAGLLTENGLVNPGDLRLALSMIRATARPLEAWQQGEVLARFLDADFQVFASLPEDYDRYVAGVRQEYSFVSDEIFYFGRGSFLHRLDQEVQQRGYFFREASPLAESLARSNLERELRALTRVPGA